MFSMESGHHVSEVADRIDDVDADLRYVAYTGWFGSAAVFDGDVDRAIRVLRDWPGVLSASRAGLIPLQSLSDPQARALATFVRLELGDPIVGDQSIQAWAGDVVTVTYRPPMGVEHTISVVMCATLTTDDVLDGGLGEIPPCA
jgi:hypothetical protein